MVKSSSLFWQLQTKSGHTLALLPSKGLTAAQPFRNMSRAPTCLFPTSPAPDFHKHSLTGGFRWERLWQFCLLLQRLGAGLQLMFIPQFWSMDSWLCQRRHSLHYLSVHSTTNP